MFEDIDDKKQPISVTREADDRTVVYAIWTRNAGGGLPVDEAWSVLGERYPEEARFLLLHLYEELVAAARPATWTPSEFLVDVRKVLDAAGGRLNPEVRDLLAVAEDDLHPLAEEDASRLERLRARVSATRKVDAEASRKRLHRVAIDFVRELHDRTRGGKAIGATRAATTSAAPVAAAGGEWKTAIAGAKGKRGPYSASAKVTAGDIVEHPKFGDGVVVGIEPGRAHILFESGPRKLVVG